MAYLEVDGRKISDPVELIIFDKDGTLIDVHHYWTSMVSLRARRIVEKFRRPDLKEVLAETMGVDRKTGLLRPEGPVGIKPRSFIVNTVCATLQQRGVPTVLEEIECVFKGVDEETRQNLAPLLRLLPGVEELVARSEARGVKLAIATNDLSSRAREAMRTLGIDRYFPFIVGGEQVKAAKPAPDAGYLLIAQAKVSASHCAIIGDHAVDMEMGKNCEIGCRIGVLTGLGSRGEFSRLDCHVVESLSQLRVN